jgi:hypothetical protein
MIFVEKRNALSRKALSSIKVPEREAKHWKGIQHGVLADTLVNRVKAYGLEITDENWYVSPVKKTIMWGALDIVSSKNSPSLSIGQEAKFSLGVRHGNGGEYAVGFAVGARIVVCSNGMFQGDFVMKKRHTQGLNLEELIDNALERYIQGCETLENLINGWREVQIDDRDAAYMVLKSYRDGYVNFRYLNDFYENWNNPPHEEFAPRTAWSLYNAFTETIKDMSPPRQLRLLAGLRRMFDSEYCVGDAYLGPQSFSLN